MLPVVHSKSVILACVAEQLLPIGTSLVGGIDQERAKCLCIFPPEVKIQTVGRRICQR